MASTTVKNRVCSKCGAEVRHGALFCYSCGGSVAPELPVSETTKLDGKDIFVAGFTDEGPENTDSVSNRKKETSETTDLPIKKTEIQEGAKLQSAANMRRKSKSLQKKVVEEVVWTGHDNAPNAWFILVALGLTLLAAAIFWMALYWK